MSIENLPGYKAWTRGATRNDMQRLNRAAGRPCYCAILPSGHCDFCTGLAAEGGDRWLRQVAWQAEAARND